MVSGADFHKDAVFCEGGRIVRRLYETDELYDLEKDPMELNNVINDGYYKDKILELKERMITFFLETGDYVPDRKDIR